MAEIEDGGRIQGSLGVVVIGRNEGERLIACLASVRDIEATLVYVDSSSTDGSAERVAEMGVEVVHLDTERPFTAGRARNAGFKRLLELAPQVEYVQFIDGDCVVAPGWLQYGLEKLQNFRNENLAIVCGRRKEMYPARSIYNRICDFEWNTPIGEADACGGDFLVRSRAFQQVEGFNPALIAGEEPELCFRLRKQGWRIYRADHLMTFHDAAIYRFSQWARRATRSGYAYAARAMLHLRDASRFCWRENARIAFWGLAWPGLIVGLSILGSGWWLLLILAYPVQFFRIRRETPAGGDERGRSIYSLFVVLGKWPECFGQIVFLMRHFSRQREEIIEYK